MKPLLPLSSPPPPLVQLRKKKSVKIYPLICLLSLTKRRGVQSRIVHAPMFSALVCRTFGPNSFLREIVLQLSPGLLIAFLVAWAGTRERKTGQRPKSKSSFVCIIALHCIGVDILTIMETLLCRLCRL